MRRSVAACFALFILFNLFYNMTLPLHFDEAYYWLWSLHPAASYFDHPPLVAWLLWLVRPFGQSETVIRLVPLLCLSLSGLLLYRLARRAFGETVAERSLVLFLLLPLAQLGFLLAVPDAPLSLTWMLVMAAGYEAAFGARWRRGMLGAGAAIGFRPLTSRQLRRRWPSRSRRRCRQATAGRRCCHWR